MWELINNAREGFLSMHTGGKYTGLLLVILVYLWCRKCGHTLSGKKYAGPEKGLMVYTTLMAVICSIPVTAVLLMKYQTAFYDYTWVWAVVPATIMLAYGGTLLLEDAMDSEALKTTGSKVLFAAAFIAVFILAGGMGGREQEMALKKAEYQTTERLLNVLIQESDLKGDDVSADAEREAAGLCIWGPTMVMEYVRMIEPDMQVAYGRNMWDISLNAFSYDVYGEEEMRLYEAMSEAQNRARFSDIEMLKLAVDRGISHVVLPGYVLQADVEAAADYAGSSIRQVEGYYVLALPDKN